MKAIESFQFSARKGNASKQDWNTLFNGSIWMMEAGVDFQSKPNCFASLAKRYAKNMGFGLRIGRDGENVVLQAYKMQATEIAAPAIEADESSVDHAEVSAPAAPAASAAPAIDAEECSVEQADIDAPTSQEQLEQNDYMENAAMGFSPAAPAAPKARRKRS